MQPEVLATNPLRQKRFVGILIIIAVLLLIPLVAMQFSSEVNWSPTDFALMGVMLLFTGCSIEIVLRKVRQQSTRLPLLIIIILGFLTIWAELSVGIFNSSFAGN